MKNKYNIKQKVYAIVDIVLSSCDVEIVEGVIDTIHITEGGVFYKISGEDGNQADWVDEEHVHTDRKKLMNDVKERLQWLAGRKLAIIEEGLDRGLKTVSSSDDSLLEV